MSTVGRSSMERAEPIGKSLGIRGGAQLEAASNMAPEKIAANVRINIGAQSTSTRVAMGA